MIRKFHITGTSVAGVVFKALAQEMMSEDLVTILPPPTTCLFVMRLLTTKILHNLEVPATNNASGDSANDKADANEIADKLYTMKRN